MGLDVEFNFQEPWDLAIAACLVVLSGIVAGLTIGIMGVDQLELRVLEENCDPALKPRYQRLANLLQHHHLILVALLVVNTICQETLPLFLNRMFPEWATVLFAVTFVLLFGEIIPQAVCSGSHRIAIITFCSPFILGVSWLFWPVAWPISKLLDKVVGIHSDKYYGRADLKTVVRLHEKGARLDNMNRQRSMQGGASAVVETDGLLADEVVVIEGALDLAKKGVAEIMVPIERVYALEESQILDERLRHAIVEMGHSRIPVYRETRENIIGMLFVKNLVAEPNPKPVGAVPPFLVRDYLARRQCPKFVVPSHKLYDLMNDLQTGRHLALVTSDPAWHVARWEADDQHAREPPPEKRILGIVTIEDIFEELIQEEIYDEFDRNGELPSFSGNATGISALVKAMKIATDVDEARASQSAFCDAATELVVVPPQSANRNSQAAELPASVSGGIRIESIRIESESPSSLATNAPMINQV